MTEKGKDVEMWRLPKVMQITGLSKPSIYRKMSEGNFPKSYKIGERAVAHRSDEVMEWRDNLEVA